ncbi:MAG: Hpt domain-containing protein [Alcanivoracaceae bacterium]
MDTSALLDMDLVGELRDIMAEGFAGLVDSYEQDTARKLDLMRTALEGDARDTLRQLAHSLKGSSSNVGALEVSGCCLTIEQKAGDGQPDQLQHLLDELTACHQQAMEALRSLV